MSDRHLTRDEILALMSGTLQNSAALLEHIEHCDVCWKVYEELAKSDAFAIVMRETLEHVDDDGLELDFSETWRSIDDDEERAERDAHEADALFLRLAQHSPDEWGEIVGANPHVCTAALVQRLIDAAGLELDRKPDHALVLLNTRKPSPTHCGATRSVFDRAATFGNSVPMLIEWLAATMTRSMRHTWHRSSTPSYGRLIQISRSGKRATPWPLLSQR